MISLRYYIIVWAWRSSHIGTSIAKIIKLSNSIGASKCPLLSDFLVYKLSVTLTSEAVNVQEIAVNLEMFNFLFAAANLILQSGVYFVKLLRIIIFVYKVYFPYIISFLVFASLRTFRKCITIYNVFGFMYRTAHENFTYDIKINLFSAAYLKVWFKIISYVTN